MEDWTVRYARQRALPGIGKEGQLRLGDGAVLVIGCGALGSLAAMYLAGAGVGKLRICDFDTIDISNLQRQLFYSDPQAGESKAKVLASRIKDLNPWIEVEEKEELFTRKNADILLDGIDFVVEGSDNPASKYLIDEICHEKGLPYCIGGVREYGGQVMSCIPGTMRYSELFPDRPSDSGFTPCEKGGVLGPAAGMTASFQAGEAIKYLCGVGNLLTDRIFTFDLMQLQAGIIER